MWGKTNTKGSGRRVTSGQGSVNADGAGHIIFSVSGLPFRPKMVWVVAVRTDQLASNPNFSTQYSGAHQPNPFFKFENYTNDTGTVVMNDGQYTGLEGQYLNINDSGFSARLDQSYGTSSDSSNFTYRWVASE